jgi:hypothetical protein
VELTEALEVLARPLRDMSVALRGIFRLLADVRMVMEDHLWETEEDIDGGPSTVREMLGDEGVEELRRDVGLLAEEQEEFRQWYRSVGLGSDRIAYSMSEAHEGGRSVNDSREIPPEEVGDAMEE